MNSYDFAMKPLEALVLHPIRKYIISKAKGDVLEIGLGTGVNLPYYNDKYVQRIYGIDPKITKETQHKIQKNITLVQASAESIPFQDNQFDTIVSTLVFCSFKNPSKAIQEIKRVLKPGGQLLIY